MHETLRRLMDAASTNDGLLSVAEAKKLGATSLQLTRWVDRGHIKRIGRQSITFPGQPESWRLKLKAALTDAGPTAVASHRSAAVLHRFDGYQADEIEVTVPRANRRKASVGVSYSTTFLPKIDRCEVDGLPATSATRTVIDLAAVASAQRLEDAVDSAVRQGGTTTEFLAKRVAKVRKQGRAGGPKLDEVLVDTGGANRLERRFLLLCRVAGLPRPSCQVIHREGVRVIARVDFDFSPASLVVEVEGQVAHASPRERQRDAERRRALHRSGRVVYSFTYEDVFERPAIVIAEVASAVGATVLGSGFCAN